MAVASTPNCPICLDDFVEPKLLECNHTMCRGCVLQWLSDPEHVGCPMCRAPILAPSAGPLPGSLSKLVDALPTDLIIVARQPAPRARSAVDTERALFCCQCTKIICATCMQNYRTYQWVTYVHQDPFRDPAAICHVDCSSHKDTQFCWTHRTVVCELCARTAHSKCLQHSMEKTAVREREELTQQLQGFRRKEQLLRNKIKDMKAAVIRTHAAAADEFNKLLQCIGQRREEVDRIIDLSQDWVDSRIHSVRLTAWAQVMGSLGPDTSEGNFAFFLSEMRGDNSHHNVLPPPSEQSAALSRYLAQQADLLRQHMLRISQTLAPHPPHIMFSVRQLAELTSTISTLGTPSEQTKLQRAAAVDRVMAAAHQASLTQEYYMPLRGELREDMITSRRLKSLRSLASLIFNSLTDRVKRRQQEVHAQIQVAEHQIPHLENMRASLTSHAGVLDNLLQTSNDILLVMKASLAPRLKRLRQQVPRIDKIKGPATFTWDQQQICRLVAAISSLGMPFSTIRGAALARVLKIKDRVQLNRYYDLPRRARERQGTVIAVPSMERWSQGLDPTGRVDVQWDGGTRQVYYMGCGGVYDLDLVSSPSQSTSAPETQSRAPSEWCPEELINILSPTGHTLVPERGGTF